MFIHTELKRNKQWVFEIFEVKTEINDHPVKKCAFKLKKFFLKVLWHAKFDKNRRWLLKKIIFFAVIQMN